MKKAGSRAITNTFDVLKLFIQKRSVSTKDIQESLDLSLRQAQRYMKDLKNELYLVEDKDKKGYYMLPDNHKFENLVKNDDRFLLLTALEHAKHIFPVERADAVDKLIQQYRVDNLKGKLTVLDSSSIDYSKIESAVAELGHYINIKTPITFYYTKDNKEKIVSPYKIIFYKGFWYLIGLNESSEIRTYRLDKINGTILPAVGVRFSEGDPYKREIIENTKSIWITYNKYLVDIELDDEIVEYFKDRQIIANTEVLKEKPYTIRVTTYHLMALYLELMPYAPHFKILSEDAKKFFREKMEEALERFK